MALDSSFLTPTELLSCMELGKALTSELEPEKLFGTIVHKVSRLLPAENWSLLLLDEATGELVFKITVGIELTVVRDIRLGPGQGVAGQAVIRRETLVIPDVEGCPFFDARVDAASGFKTRSIICAPLSFGGRVLGALEVVNPTSLDQRALALASLIADYAAIAVENTRRYAETHHAAVHDNLTGLFNTRYLYQALARLIEEGAGSREPFSLVFLDLDNFKRIVDTYGHLSGSRAIQEVAATIREALAEPCFGVSYGGDEFVVVLPGFTKAQALAKADEIRERMARTRYLAEESGVHITASFGLAAFPEDAQDLKGLLALADRAMFRVKRSGKDAVGAGAQPDQNSIKEG